MIRRNNRRRRGIGLIEVLAFVTISSIVLTLMCKSLNRMLDHRHCTQRATQTQRSVARLAINFRRNVRRSTDVDVHASRKEMTLRCPSGTIEYVVDGTLLTTAHRFESEIRREEYALPMGASFELSNDSATGLVTLWVKAPKPTVVNGSASATPAPKAAFSLVARLGKYETATGPTDDASVTP